MDSNSESSNAEDAFERYMQQRQLKTQQVEEMKQRTQDVLNATMQSHKEQDVFQNIVENLKQTKQLLGQDEKVWEDELADTMKREEAELVNTRSLGGLESQVSQQSQLVDSALSSPLNQTQSVIIKQENIVAPKNSSSANAISEQNQSNKTKIQATSSDDIELKRLERETFYMEKAVKVQSKLRQIMTQQNQQENLQQKQLLAKLDALKQSLVATSKPEGRYVPHPTLVNHALLSQNQRNWQFLSQYFELVRKIRDSLKENQKQFDAESYRISQLRILDVEPQIFSKNMAQFLLFDTNSPFRFANNFDTSGNVVYLAINGHFNANFLTSAQEFAQAPNNNIMCLEIEDLQIGDSTEGLLQMMRILQSCLKNLKFLTIAKSNVVDKDLIEIAKIVNFNNLTHLDLRYNLISALPVHSLPNLLELVLQSNIFKKFDYEFQSLQILRISENQITDFSPIIPNIVSINASNSNFQTFKFQDKPLLKDLNLSKCHLRFLFAEHLVVPQLEQLVAVQYNNIDLTMFNAVFPSLKRLELEISEPHVTNLQQLFLGKFQSLLSLETVIIANSEAPVSQFQELTAAFPQLRQFLNHDVPKKMFQNVAKVQNLTDFEAVQMSVLADFYAQYRHDDDQLVLMLPSIPGKLYNYGVDRLNLHEIMLNYLSNLNLWNSFQYSNAKDWSQLYNIVPETQVAKLLGLAKQMIRTQIMLQRLQLVSNSGEVEVSHHFIAMKSAKAASIIQETYRRLRANLRMRNVFKIGEDNLIMLTKLVKTQLAKIEGERMLSQKRSEQQQKLLQQQEESRKQEQQKLQSEQLFALLTKTGIRRLDFNQNLLKIKASKSIIITSLRRNSFRKILARKLDVAKQKLNANKLTLIQTLKQQFNEFDDFDDNLLDIPDFQASELINSEPEADEDLQNTLTGILLSETQKVEQQVQIETLAKELEKQQLQQSKMKELSPLAVHQPSIQRSPLTQIPKDNTPTNQSNIFAQPEDQSQMHPLQKFPNTFGKAKMSPEQVEKQKQTTTRALEMAREQGWDIQNQAAALTFLKYQRRHNKPSKK